MTCHGYGRIDRHRSTTMYSAVRQNTNLEMTRGSFGRPCRSIQLQGHLRYQDISGSPSSRGEDCTAPDACQALRGLKLGSAKYTTPHRPTES